MKRSLIEGGLGLWGLVLLLMAAAGCRSEGYRLVDPAPLAVRNQHPVQLTRMHAGPRPPRAVASGESEAELSVDWTSLWLRPGDGFDRIELDGEILRLTPTLRYGLGQGFDLSLGLPFQLTSGGVLDSFIETWHEIFALPQNRRDQFARDRFVVRADTFGAFGLQPAYQMNERPLRPADWPIALAWFPELDGEAWSFGVQGGIELPTGDEDDGFGNGELDWMLGMIGSWRSERVALSAWGGWTWSADDPKRARSRGLQYGDAPNLGGSLEFALSDRLSALAQVEWERSLLQNLDDRHANRDQVLLWLGGRWRLGEQSALEFAVGEDLVRSVSPDVTFHVAWRIGL